MRGSQPPGRPLGKRGSKFLQHHKLTRWLINENVARHCYDREHSLLDGYQQRLTLLFPNQIKHNLIRRNAEVRFRSHFLQAPRLGIYQINHKWRPRVALFYFRAACKSCPPDIVRSIKRFRCHHWWADWRVHIAFLSYDIGRTAERRLRKEAVRLALRSLRPR